MNRRRTTSAALVIAGAVGLSAAALPSALASSGAPGAAPQASTCTIPNDPTNLSCTSTSPSASASSSPTPSPSASTSSPTPSPSASTCTIPNDPTGQSCTASPAPSASASSSASGSPTPSPSASTCTIPNDPTGRSCTASPAPSPSASTSPSASPSASPAAQQGSRLQWVGDDAIGFGDQVFAAAVLTSAAGRPLAGRSVDLVVGHDSTEATTDSDGLAYAVFPATGATGSVAALVTFSGDAADRASSTRAGISVHTRSTGLRAVESGRRGRYAEVVTVLLGADYARGAYGADERSGISRLRAARVEVRVGRGRARTYTCDAYGRLQLRGLTRGEAVTIAVLPSRGRWSASRVRLVAGRGGVRDLPRTTGR